MGANPQDGVGPWKFSSHVHARDHQESAKNMGGR